MTPSRRSVILRPSSRCRASSSVSKTAELASPESRLALALFAEETSQNRGNDALISRHLFLIKHRAGRYHPRRRAIPIPGKSITRRVIAPGASLRNRPPLSMSSRLSWNSLGSNQAASILELNGDKELARSNGEEATPSYRFVSTFRHCGLT